MGVSRARMGGSIVEVGGDGVSEGGMGVWDGVGEFCFVAVAVKVEDKVWVGDWFIVIPGEGVLVLEFSGANPLI